MDRSYFEEERRRPPIEHGLIDAGEPRSEQLHLGCLVDAEATLKPLALGVIAVRQNLTHRNRRSPALKVTPLLSLRLLSPVEQSFGSSS